MYINFAGKHCNNWTLAYFLLVENKISILISFIRYLSLWKWYQRANKGDLKLTSWNLFAGLVCRLGHVLSLLSSYSSVKITYLVEAGFPVHPSCSDDLWYVGIRETFLWSLCLVDEGSISLNKYYYCFWFSFMFHCIPKISSTSSPS